MKKSTAKGKTAPAKKAAKPKRAATPKAKAKPKAKAAAKPKAKVAAPTKPATPTPSPFPIQAAQGPLTSQTVGADQWISNARVGNLGKLSFYVVDDDPGSVALVTRLLEEAGHEVRSATSSLTALAEIIVQKPDVVILDLMMPDLDGLELCAMLRAKPSTQHIKVVVVSAKAYEFDRKRALDVGANGYIQKPINVETFVERVHRIVEDKVDMTFWGVRGTLPVTGGKSLRYGGNTSCVTLEFPRHQLFVFDAGSGIKALSDWLLRQKRKRIEAKLFISHPHWDHVNALPFFVPLYMPGNEFEICGARHGDTTMRELISAQMDGIYFPITFQEFGARVYFRDLDEEEFKVDQQIAVKTMLLSHPGRCLGYRINYNGRSICYVTDNELFLEDSEFHNPFYVQKLTDFVRGTDALITDSTYTDTEYLTKVGWGHSCLSEVAKLAHNAEVKTLYLFHHDPDQNDNAIDRKLEMAESVLSRLGSHTRCLAPQEGQVFRV